MQNFAELTIHSAKDVVFPTEEILDLYIDVTNYLNKKHLYYGKIEKVLKFFDINPDKAFKFLKNFFVFDDFIHQDELCLMLKKYKEVGISDYRQEVYPFLNKLLKDGKINTKEIEELVKLVN